MNSAYYRLGFLAILLCLITPINAQRETIKNFSAVMDIRSDGSIEVTETITVVADGGIIKRGITRAINREPINGDKDGTFSYELVSATRNGVSIRPFKENNKRLTTFYLGSKDETIPPGEYTYVFTYTSEDQIYFLDQLDEVRWHLIDTDGKLPVERADITVRFPGGTNIMNAACYAGREGTQDDACRLDQDRNKATFTLARPLVPGEGMTVSVSAPRGTFLRPKPPTTLQKNGTRWATLAGLASAIIFGFLSWWQSGRDPKGPEVTNEYYAPEGISPASAYYLLYGHSTVSALTASLTELAIKGYVRVEEVNEEGGFLGIGKKEFFILHQTDLRPQASAIAPEQLALYDKLFEKKGVIELDGKYNAHLGKVAITHSKSLQKQHKAFLKDGNQWEKVLPIIYIFVAMLIVALVFIKTAAPGSFAILAVASFSFVLGTIAYGYLMRQPSYEKVALKNQLKGLRKYLKLSNKKRDAIVDAPDMTEAYFEQMLPYAIVFGQDNTWADNLSTDWINSSQQQQGGHYHYLYAPTFGQRFGSSVATTAYQASSGGGGGSSFSSGGGSVGGGGGGTGGF